jgi:predicted ABC-type transport system involved in lysophospholipase L1 biosynthesis ATPase subunit
MAGAWLRVYELGRTYRLGRKLIHALDGVSFMLERGECVAVVGASGSGKSTLLNLLGGLDTPSSGEIVCGDLRLHALDGRALARYRARAVGFVFQAFNLLPQHSALRNVELALLFAGLPARERRRRAGDVLERLGLGDRLDHRPADLSGGEQQRVALARALAKDPELLLADEPTGNLDEGSAHRVAELLRDQSDLGIAVVAVTHDSVLADRVANRKLRLHYGRLVETAASAPEDGA